MQAYELHAATLLDIDFSEGGGAYSREGGLVVRNDILHGALFETTTFYALYAHLM